MAAPKKNQYWKLRKDMTKTGRKLTVEEVCDKAQEYIDYCVNTPIYEVDFKGKDAKKVRVPKMRAMSLQGLCSCLGIVVSTWYEWKSQKKYSEIMAHIEQIMYAYKFEGAAAGQLNPSIIARDLGLKERTDLTSDDEKLEATVVKVGYGKKDE